MFTPKHTIVLLTLMLAACSNEKKPQNNSEKVIIPVFKYITVKEQPCTGEDCAEKNQHNADTMTHDQKKMAGKEHEEEKAVCPQLAYANEFKIFGQDKDKLNCNLKFDDVGLCADIFWKTSEGVVAKDQVLCMYFWDIESPSAEPDYAKLDYDLGVHFSMDGNDQSMGHSDFDAKVEKLQDNIYALYSINFAMKGVWKTKFTLSYEEDVISEFTTLLNVEDQFIDYDWEGL